MIYEGPFDREEWPERFPARVVDPRGERRIHGYCVRGDLVHHGIADLAWLAIQGELPTPVEREAFTTALAYLAPVHVGESSSHATLLARLVGARPSAVVSVAATGLAEQGRSERDSLAPWFAWLEAPMGDPPAIAVEPAPTPEAIADQVDLAARSAIWFGPERALPGAVVLTRLACAHGLMHRLGFRDRFAIEALAVWARLLVVVAESGSIRGGAVRMYPARLPDYQYVDADGRSA